MIKQQSLQTYVQQFFSDHLAVQRGVSHNTIKAYRDVIKLFLTYAATESSKKVTNLKPTHLSAELVVGFLKSIESHRGNGAITRNHRLAALRSLFSFLATKDPIHLGNYQKIMLVPFKRAAKRRMCYLEVDELRAVINSIDRSNIKGRRDYALMCLLYNTGARVQEICDLTVGSLRLESPSHVVIHGKGKKERHVPLWEETRDILQNYLAEMGISSSGSSPLFTNHRGDPIGRFGVRYIVRKYCRIASLSMRRIAGKKVGPHTFRHTTAMHLLQSGVDLTIIKSWLGHVDVSTTHEYVEIDMNMKRAALEKCNPKNQNSNLEKFIIKNQNIITWLESL